MENRMAQYPVVQSMMGDIIRNIKFPTALSNVAASAPYKIATFGDSRVNVNSTVPDVNGTGQSLSPLRVPAWFAAARGDCEISYNYGVSGDTPDLWAALNRTGGKTFVSCVNSDADIVYIEYGINMITTWNGTGYAAQVALIVGYLTALISTLVKAGKYVFYESINPCYASVYGANAALKLQMTIDVNVAMGTYISNLNGAAAWIHTFDSLTDSTGYANPILYADGTHFNINGAMQAGTVGAAKSLAFLPRKQSDYFYLGTQSPNFIDQIAPVVNTIADNGTATFATPVFGIDSVYGHYIEFTITPLTLSSGEMRWRVSIGTTVGSYSGSTPNYLISAGEVLQGSCRLSLDDGTGKPCKVNNLVVRQRVFYQAGGSSSADWGASAQPAGYPSLLLPIVNMYFAPPKITSTTDSSGIVSSQIAQGYNLEITGNIPSLTSFRLRIYNPSLRAVNRLGGNMINTYAASVTPDLASTNIVSITPLTGNITVANPAQFPPDGTLVSFNFVQDGTGGRTVSWGANYIFPTAWSNTGNTLGKKSKILFISDGLNLIAQGANSWY